MWRNVRKGETMGRKPESKAKSPQTAADGEYGSRPEKAIQGGKLIKHSVLVTKTDACENYVKVRKDGQGTGEKKGRSMSKKKNSFQEAIATKEWGAIMPSEGVNNRRQSEKRRKLLEVRGSGTKRHG